MEITAINPYTLKIIIAARSEDSINAISKRIKLSYGWTHKWVQELIRIGVFQEKNRKIALQKNNAFYRQTINYIRQTFSQSVSFHYSVLQLFGMTYCFTKTDAVFVWTKGGYNISRSKEYYPIFIKVKEKELFEYYCEKLGLRTNAKKGIFYVPEFADKFDISFCENIPVEPLETTIEFMKKNIYNFQPALEMVGEMYGCKLAKYAEVMTNV